MTSFSISETFPHPPKKVFNGFASPEALVQWIAPMDGIPTNIEQFEFTPEGRYRITFEMGDQTLCLEGQFLAIRAYDHISFTWIWQHPAPHAGVESHVNVSLHGNEAETELTLTHSRLDAPGMTERHKEGWRNSFTRLHNFFAGTNE